VTIAEAVAVYSTPGAHTPWHAHSRGQTLHVTEGVGLIQCRGEDVVTIRPGHTIYTPADSGTGTAPPAAAS